MKILLVSLNYFPERTGIGKFQSEMAEWFAARGHSVRVIAAPPYYPAWKIAAPYSGWRYRHEKIAGVDVWRAPLYVPTVPNGIKVFAEISDCVRPSENAISKTRRYSGRRVRRALNAASASLDTWSVGRISTR